MQNDEVERVAAGLDLAHDALDRMKRAYDRGTGCHLTAEMIAALNITFLGEVWNDDRPSQGSPQ